MPDLTTCLCGRVLKNPVIAASGTFGFGREYDRFYDISQLGGISVKGLTLQPRKGNPPNRIAETPSGILNAVGLQNPGVDAFIEKDLAWLLNKKITILINVAGSAIEDYCAIVEKVSQHNIHFIELNISCPNVRSGGAAFGSRPESVYEVVRAVRPLAKKPLIVKLTPNVADIAQAACAAEQAGADGISLINTIPGMAVDVHTRRPILGNIVGGLSGPAIKPIALRMVWQASRAVHIPVIGMGGIMTGEDAIAFMLCGASAVQVGSANLVDPYACPKIIGQIQDYMTRHGVEHVRDLIGTLEF